MNEEEMNSLPEKEFRIMIVKMVRGMSKEFRAQKDEEESTKETEKK